MQHYTSLMFAMISASMFGPIDLVIETPQRRDLHKVLYGTNEEAF